MKLNRRHLLQTAAAFGLTGTRSWAMTEAVFDEFTIRSLSDGKLVLPTGFFLAPDADASEAKPILSDAGATGETYDSPLNLTLLSRGDDIILFDAGSGPGFMATAGKLPEALSVAGISPDQVTHVIFTHAHPDHIWGCIDDFDEPVFVNARHLIGRAEYDYWMDATTAETIDPARLSFVAGATRRFELLGERFEFFEDGDEIMPKIKAVMTPGHTPGHMSFDIHEQAFVTGDVITNPHLAFIRPDILSGSDQDPELAAKTRLRMLNFLSDSSLTIIGYHLPNGGIGQVWRDGEGFTFRQA